MLQFVFALQVWFLGTHQPQHDGPVFWNLLQGFESARALVVVFEQEALKVRLAKHLCDWAVVASGIKLTLMISSPQMQPKDDPGAIANHRVVHFDRQIEQAIRVVPSLSISFP